MYQCSEMHPDLQATLDREFHMVRPGEEEGVREKITALFVWVTPSVTQELLTSLPNLKVVGNCAVDYDHIDLNVCTERGIRVGYTPNVLNKTTADMVWALLLASGRKVVEGDASTALPEELLTEISGKEKYPDLLILTKAAHLQGQ